MKHIDGQKSVKWIAFFLFAIMAITPFITAIYYGFMLFILRLIEINYKIY